MKTLIISFLTLLSALFTCFLGQKNYNGIAIIVHKDNPIGALTPDEIKLYYLRKIKKRWPGINKNICPADRKDKCIERELFYAKILGMTAIDVEQHFINKHLQNAERPQNKFATDADIIDFVAEEAGAIGYINVQSFSPEAKKKVKKVYTLLTL